MNIIGILLTITALGGAGYLLYGLIKDIQERRKNKGGKE